MKTFGEILSAIKSDDLANAIVSNVFTSEADMAHFQECIIDSLNDLAHIVPINNANPPILWPFVQNESVAINVVHIHTESIFGKYDAIVKITCVPLIEYLAGREGKESRRERLASFLGMHVNPDCITEKDLLPFVVTVLGNILRDDTVNTRTHYTYDDMYRLDTTYALTDENAYFEVSYYFGSSNAPSDNLTYISTETATYEFEYGCFSLRTKMTVGNRTLATYSYTNDKNKYLETLAYGNGDKVKYTYDELGRVVKETYYENGSTTVYATVTYQYDNTGALASVYDSKTGKTVKYYYDTVGRVSGLYEIGGTAHSLRYTYDDLGRPTAIIDTYGSTTYSTEYTYDGQGHIFSVDNGDASEFYFYDSHDRFHEAYTYHGDSNTYLIHKTIGYEAPDDRSTSNRVSMWNYATTGGFGRNYNYLYDGNGNIVRVKQDGDKYTYYQYDSANQLIREDNQAAGKTWVWTYDDGGNIKSRKEYAYTTVPTEDLGSPSKTYTYGYDISDWGDLLKSYNGTAFSYDTIGNITFDGHWNYSWEKGRQLSQMYDDNMNAIWNFTYDASGMRTKRYSSGATYNYVYNGSQLAHMTYGNNILHFTYDANGGPLSVNYNGTTYYYVLNLQGDVVAILNSYGVQVVGYTYDAWGKLLTTTGSMAGTLGLHNPLLYRGYVYDRETGLYYLQSRYYNPEIGRFISADAYVSTGQGVLGNNMFVYCNNNPVLMHDPTGELGVVTLMIIGAVVGAGIEYASQVIKNHKAGLTGAEAWTPSNYGALASSAFSGALSAIPGAGSFLATAADIVGSAVIEQGVNSLCYGTTWSWSKLKEDVIGNIAGALISKTFKLAEDVPQYLRHIKSEARDIGIKGTRKLTKYLNAKQVLVIVKNSFNSATLGELIP